ncbi:hypothetical protein AUJ69_03600 [Candidatus Woesearchaeota archaeon CG1_02_47_18]|nr:MAG: hypothetical protein AUJ69_03600 [Candidatus Woesearchaeota archaeon CG1_02_47_18]HII29573.1 hypothetical protein [Candidatus Woesearchaeota archaeon]
MRVLLDTNFLMIPSEFGIDIFSELERIITGKAEPCVLEGSIGELKRLASGIGKKSRAAALALKLVEKKGLRILRTAKLFKAEAYHPTSTVDDMILALAERGNLVVATQDKELKRRLKALDVPIVVMRQKSYLAFDEN